VHFIAVRQCAVHFATADMLHHCVKQCVRTDIDLMKCVLLCMLEAVFSSQEYVTGDARSHSF